MTEKGLLSYTKVIKIVCKYLEKLQKEWLSFGGKLEFFDEVKRIADIDYEMYKTPDSSEHICDIAGALIHYSPT